MNQNDSQQFTRDRLASEYNGEKQAHGGQIAGSNQNDYSAKTHDRLAAEYGVGSATIQRDGQFAEAVDKLASVGIDPQTLIAKADKAAMDQGKAMLQCPWNRSPARFQAV